MSEVAGQEACRLLALPAELRNVIYAYILIQGSGHSASVPVKSSGERFCANVLRTCKQINKEGTEMLYGENLFLAHPSLLASLPAFLVSTRPHRITLPPVTSLRVSRMIKRYYIHVRLDTDPRFTRAEVEESFTGANHLEVEVFQAMYGSCDFSVLHLFEGVRGVGLAVVQGSVGDGKYAEYLERCMMSPHDTRVPPYSEKYIGGSWAWDAWQHGNR